jgi:hypothetical protein
MHRSKRVTVFSLSDSGETSISTARGRLRPEVTSLIDGTTMVFYTCFIETYHPFFNLSQVHSSVSNLRLNIYQVELKASKLDDECEDRQRGSLWITAKIESRR